MQLFSADARVFSKKKKKKIDLKKEKKRASKVAQTLFSHSPAQATAHSPKLIFHILKSRDQISVLLSVMKTTYILTKYYTSVNTYS